MASSAMGAAGVRCAACGCRRSSVVDSVSLVTNAGGLGRVKGAKGLKNREKRGAGRARQARNASADPAQSPGGATPPRVPPGCAVGGATSSFCAP